MHGGFENETPNIPTNSIVKLDLLSIFKGNQLLLDKLKSVVGPGSSGRKGGSNDGSENRSRSGGDNKSTDDSWSNGSKTPPSNGSKSPTIRFDPIQIVGPTDNKPV
jgi:hypothetical protein